MNEYFKANYLRLPSQATQHGLLHPPLSEDRLNRQAKLEPVMQAINERDEFPPGFSKDDIPGLLEMLKDEGNTFFREKDFLHAYEMYSSALFIIGKFKDWVSRNVDWQLISTFFSNRATSLLKMDYYKACVNDCNNALMLNSRNLKAHFRKALALKLLGDYVSARSAAEIGRKASVEESKTSEVKEFEELLREINSHPTADCDHLSSGRRDDTDVPLERVYSVERKKKWEEFDRIQAMFRNNPFSPGIDVDYLNEIMLDLAKEAKRFVGERNYSIAKKLCMQVLGIANHLETQHFKSVDKTFLSKTILDRAICGHKMDLFDEAVKDCDFALYLDASNAEAVYRKALVMKAKKCHKEAFSLAVSCRQMALERNDIRLVKLCNVLIHEADSHLTQSKGRDSVLADSGAMTDGTEPPGTVALTASGASAAASVSDSTSGATSGFVSEAVSKAKPKKRWKKKNVVSAPVETQENGTRSGVNTGVSKIDDSSGIATEVNTTEGGQTVTAQPATSQNPVLVNFDKSASQSSESIPSKQSRNVVTKSKVIAESKPVETGSIPADGKTNQSGKTDSILGEIPLLSTEEKSKNLAASKSTEIPIIEKSNQHLNLESGEFVAVSDKGKSKQAVSTASKVPEIPNISVIEKSNQDDALNSGLGEFVTFSGKGKSKQAVSTASKVPEITNITVEKKSKQPISTLVKEKPKQGASASKSKSLVSVAAVTKLPSHPADAVPSKSVAESGVKNTEKLSHTYVESLAKKVSVPESKTAAPIKPALLPVDLASTKVRLGSSATQTTAPVVQPSMMLKHNSPIEVKSEPLLPGSKADPSIGSQKKKKKNKPSPVTGNVVYLSSTATSNDSSKALYPLRPPSFPLGSSSDFRLTCVRCFKENSPPLSIPHNCSEDILIVQNKKTERWFVVRECKNQNRVGGTHMMCWHVAAGNNCPRGVNCTFAHNSEELKLWNLQTRGNFRIDAFVASNRSPGNLSSYSVQSVYRKYEGMVRMICGACMREHNRIVTQDLRNPKCDANLHDLRLSKILAHRAKNNKVTFIGKRPFPSKKAFFNLCYQRQYCRKKTGCISAHSEIERDIWYVERDTGLKQEEIINEWYQLSLGRSTPQPIPSIDRQSSGRSTPSGAISSPCPYEIHKVCGLCLKNGSRVQNTEAKSRCANNHSWNLNAVYLVLPQKKIVKELPQRIPWNKRFRICRFANDCHIGGMCQFAHSQEEIHLWTWMMENKVQTLDAAMERHVKKSNLQRASSTPSLCERRSSTGTPAAWATPTPTTAATTSLLGQEESFYCLYCSLACNSQAQLEAHCSSARHMSNINSDKDHQWNFHQPPWNVYSGNYRLCTWHLQGKCRFSNVPESSNLCTFAHSQAELDEWVERYRWRQMKRKLAMDENLFSYMDRLLEDYNENGDSVLSEDVKNVSAMCSCPLFFAAEDKDTKKSWNFQLKTSGLVLKKVALLLHDSRLHFVLDLPMERGCQMSQGETFKAGDYKYHVTVQFKGGIYGSFQQWVVFDFGLRPALVRKLSVELGQLDLQKKLRNLRDELHLDRWTSRNKKIVKFPDKGRAVDEFYEKLLAKYKVPNSVEIVQQIIGFDMNQNNYQFKMHSLIDLEEMTQTQVISEYNVVSMVQVKNSVGDELLGFNFAQQGELFALVPLASQMVEGSLILKSVSKVLVALRQRQTDVVYESVITEIDNRSLRGSDNVFLTLSAQCCKDLELKNGDEKEMEVQFQIDRSTFLRLHYAVDQLKDVQIIFPDIRKLHQTLGTEYKLDYSSSKLNSDQRKILGYVSRRRQHFPPPLVVYGPFGTGKTETLAEASVLLATYNSDVRILICTQTNQAADEYILRHFDPLVSSGSSILRVVRIYDKMRKVVTIDAVARKYSLLSANGAAFREPTEDDICKNQVVVTTLATSLVITRLNLRGHFTHIFVDEAAQVNECHTLLPLCLANDKTCIVLAGDHIQMVETVYSSEARDQHFHRSLVERLIADYDSIPCETRNRPKVLLTANYRNHPEIVRFVAKVFYGGEESLKAKNVQASVAEFPPLAFFAANGREEQNAKSTSFLNESEVREVVEQVKRILERWPKEWGERRADQILVTTPYEDQVRGIRSLLRKQPNRELQKVVVLRVQNVPGREFRVVIISTVRTRHVFKPGCSSELLDGTDLGFLTDWKMLNSAFTRAKSFLAVVGDPVALCSIGECSKIWHQYFKFCGQLPGSIHPPDLTLDVIRTHCDIFIASLGIPTQCKKASDGNADRVRNAVEEEEEEEEESFDVTEILDLEDWNRDFRLEPDEIIRQLVSQELQGSGEAVQQGGFPPMAAVQSENIRVQEREGHALLSYRQTDKHRPGVSAKSCDDEYDSVSDDENNVASTYNDQEPKKLKTLLKSQPEKYKRCTINIDSTKNIFARQLDKPFLYKHIKISSRRLCGHAFSGDEVVIEILREGQSQGTNVDEKIAYGQVVGILKQIINPQYRLFVCMVEEGNTGMMVPLNKGIPKIYNLESKNRPRNAANQVTVYQYLKDGSIRFEHFEKVDPYDAKSRLFVVRYLKWDPKFPRPLGIVVKVIPAGRSATEAMAIIEIEHDIPRRFKTDTEQEVQRLFSAGYVLPKATLGNRVDFRKKLVFTIDPAGSTDLDDALSFEELSPDCYQVVVHIADVSFFVNRGTKIDEEAKQRGATFYPAAGEPIHMLPSRLSADLCSLLPDQDRLTMSVFMTINARADIEKVEVKRCVIRSKFRLSYEQAEAVIKGEDTVAGTTEELAMSILMLNRIAQEWRWRRLGNSASHHSVEPEFLRGTQAHLLVEEFMVEANHQVALLLTERFPLQTPLRNQLPPNELELEEWRQRFRREARNSIALTWPFLPRGKLCTCTDKCNCISSDPKDNEKHMELTKAVWRNIMTACTDGDMEMIRTLVVSPEYHPQLSVALLYLHFLSQNSQYVCSGDLPKDECSHFSLNLSFYTHFSSPIRRYVDVVVHRLLGCMIDGRPSDYSQSELTELCIRCTDAARRARKFEDASGLAHICQLLRDKPLVVHPVIEKIDNGTFSLSCPTLRHLLHQRFKVQASWLQPSEKPEFGAEQHQTLLKWSQRIYDPLHKRSDNKVLLPIDGELNPYRHVFRASSEKWKQLLTTIRSGKEFSDIVGAVDAVERTFVNPPKGRREEEEDVSSENLLTLKGKHFCDYSMVFRESDVCRVQLSVDLLRGVLTPSVQLVSLTKSFDICTEHKRDPVACFASTNARKATRNFYPSVYEYQDLWLPVLAIEAAYSAVANDIPAVIRNVEISWRQENFRNGFTYIGIFKLGAHFCEERYFKFPYSKRQVNEDEFSDDDDCCSGYFCVRYGNIQTKTPNTELNLLGVTEVDEPYTWVGHCVLHRCSKDEDSAVVTVQLRLNSGSSFPRELLGKQSSFLATVEWISKPLPDWRMERAVLALDEAEKLAQCIALGKPPHSLDKFYLDMVTPRLRNLEVHGLNPPNITQRNAIERALKESFFLIQGPPGTGKSIVAVHLACIFRRINDTLPDSFFNKDRVHPQVMCCGPSNKSVDVIAAHLMKLKLPETVVVRVHSKKDEKEDFPIPGQLLLIKKKYRLEDRVRDKELREISLHHMIREEQWNPKGALYIRNMDERIRNKPGEVTDEEVKDYMLAITEAERSLLKLADIILITCSSSGAPRLRLAGTNIQQLIIDECGMCMEPESLIPIVTSRAKQVVLLGDHQQLQPIVLEPGARRRGLGNSMFERYSLQAMMLTTQYRMHEAIAAFPSAQFYSGKLNVGKNEQTFPSKLSFWPGGGSKPIAFIHSGGKEEALAVDTEEGGEQSKMNKDEVASAVFIVRQMVDVHHIPAKTIAILSQYRAQSTEISKKLLNSMTLKDVTVQTVVAAQGSEWDYVVLSTVRSLPDIEIERRPSLTWKRKHLGFVADEHQINVAITRARKGLIILGNKLLLETDEMWRNLIRHYEENKKIVDISTFRTLLGRDR